MGQGNLLALAAGQAGDETATEAATPWQLYGLSHAQCRATVCYPGTAGAAPGKGEGEGEGLGLLSQSVRMRARDDEEVKATFYRQPGPTQETSPSC